jgi:NAD+ kinase
VSGRDRRPAGSPGRSQDPPADGPARAVPPAAGADERPEEQLVERPPEQPARAPRPAIRHVGLVAKSGSRDATHTSRELTEWLERRGLSVACDDATRRATGADGPAFSAAERYDLVVVLGGDGTLLAVARSLVEGVPILGVNLGSLGFLTEVSRDELYPALIEVLDGRYEIEERPLLDVELVRAAGRRNESGGGDAKGTHAWRVFNDVVMMKGALSRIIELSLRVDGNLVARFRADGIIVSSPSGSTAYSLSAGGPIVHPLLPVVLLTPICPHALTLRPLVVPSAATIELTLETDQEEVYLTLDGQEGASVALRDTICVTRSERVSRLVKVSGRTFYDSLRGKLRWGGLNVAAHLGSDRGRGEGAEG